MTFFIFFLLHFLLVFFTCICKRTYMLEISKMCITLLIFVSCIKIYPILCFMLAARINVRTHNICYHLFLMREFNKQKTYMLLHILPFVALSCSHACSWRQYIAFFDSCARKRCVNDYWNPIEHSNHAFYPSVALSCSVHARAFVCICVLRLFNVWCVSLYWFFPNCSVYTIQSQWEYMQQHIFRTLSCKRANKFVVVYQCRI